MTDTVATYQRLELPKEPKMQIWEPVHLSAEESTYRMAVPGGWLYQCRTKNCTSATFVPEPSK